MDRQLLINNINKGYTGENIPFERIRRITGYLAGDVSRFNNAKRQEERDRVKHTWKGGDDNEKTSTSVDSSK